MALTLKASNNSMGLVALSSLLVSDVFSFDGDTYMLLDNPKENANYLWVFNLTRRSKADMSTHTLVLSLDATLEILGPSAVRQLMPNEIAILRNPPHGTSAKIQAIKLVRERLALGLKETKEFVEDEARRLGIAC